MYVTPRNIVAVFSSYTALPRITSVSFYVSGKSKLNSGSVMMNRDFVFSFLSLFGADRSRIFPGYYRRRRTYLIVLVR